MAVMGSSDWISTIRIKVRNKFTLTFDVKAKGLAKGRTFPNLPSMGNGRGNMKLTTSKFDSLSESCEFHLDR